METIKLTIDNLQVEVPKGTNLVEAAAGAGIKIPTLCYMNLHELNYTNNPGVCRICVVEVEGRKNLAPACKTVCTEGMVVRTHTPRVIIPTSASPARKTATARCRTSPATWASGKPNIRAR